MAFGFSPKYKESIALDNLNQSQFLVLAVEALKKLKWEISYISETGFIAYTKVSMTSWSEEVTLKIDNGLANLKSECTGNQFLDWGKNRENIDRFIFEFTQSKINLSEEDLNQKFIELQHTLVS